MAGTSPIHCNTGVIALEGLDGCGTTTQAKLLTARMAAEGIPATQTQEPSDGYVGKLIREALTTTEEKSSETFPAFLGLLFAADRLEHLERVVRPALERGEWVITDRSVLSSLAYQSLELSGDWVESINDFAPIPRIVVWLDTPVEQCLTRIQGRPEERERYEKRETLSKLQPAYESLMARAIPGVELIRIDGEPPAQPVHDAVWEAIQRAL